MAVIAVFALLLGVISLPSLAAVNLLPADAAEWSARLSLKQGDTSPDRLFEFIPVYRGSALPGGAPIQWKSECFDSISATLASAPDKDGAWALTMKFGKHKSLTCQDGYFLAFVGSFDAQWISSKGTHTVLFKGNYTEAHLYDLKTLGLRVFQFKHGLVSTLAEVIETATMFVGYLVGHDMPSWGVEKNVEFLKHHMNYTMPRRSQPTRVDLPMSEFHSGDLLGIMRLDGLDSMLAWAMGARMGHEAVIMEMTPGVMSVCESNTQSKYWPVDGVQCNELSQWLDWSEKAQYLVTLLPLREDLRDKFDVVAVRKFIESVKGLPYGFHNQFTGWIDTDEDNYPGELNSHLVMILLNIIEWITGDLLHAGTNGDMFASDLNLRLGTTGLNTAEAYMVAGQRGISFTELAKIPENDSWIFHNDKTPDGPSMVCCAFAANIYKHSGLFGDVVDQVQATEFTDWDVYSLAFFDNKPKRPDVCANADPEVPYCQLLGDYRMILDEGYGTVKPHSHMSERCPTKDPLYIRPEGC